jgi:hypothetical protein
MQAERYPDVRKIAPATPRFLRRLIRDCLRARPTRRISSISHARRVLERALGRPSPLDCRGEIAQHLWAQGAFSAADGRTAVQKAPPTPARIATRQYIRWGMTAATGLLVVIAGAAGSAQYLRAPADPPPDIPRAERVAPALTVAAPPVAALPVPATVEPAHVRFVVDPWAEITIDGGSSFFTPRAAPVELQPGSHRVVLLHPTFGRSELTLDVEPGETRMVRHVFARVKPS